MRFADEACVYDGDMVGYSGGVAVTISGAACRPWAQGGQHGWREVQYIITRFFTIFLIFFLKANGPTTQTV